MQRSLDIKGIVVEPAAKSELKFPEVSVKPDLRPAPPLFPTQDRSTERGKVRVLQVLDTYLETTTNWIYKLVSNLPDAEVAIAAKTFLKCNFYPRGWRYLQFPLQPIEDGRRTFVTRMFNRLVSASSRYYPRYVARFAPGVELMHSHFAPCGWEYLGVARRLRIPHVVSFYGYDYEHLPHVAPVWRRRYQQLFQEADLFVCEGPHGAEVLERNGCPREKIRVVRLGIEPKTIRCFNRQKPPECLRLVQIASHKLKKGYIYTMQAFQKALAECPNMTLTLVGKASEDGKGGSLENLRLIGAAALEAGKLQFIDGIDYARLYDFLSGYDVFIHPSCYTDDLDCEGGAPVVLLDAQATGMPVIATTHCDIPQEVLHEKTGLLSPEKDVEMLTQSIKRFYRMPTQEYQQYAERARQHVEANFDVASGARQLRALYDDILMRK